MAGEQFKVWKLEKETERGNRKKQGQYNFVCCIISGNGVLLRDEKSSSMA
jgi:hypothetical protein